jgi:hypothetical protein
MLAEERRQTTVSTRAQGHGPQVVARYVSFQR